jgi:hypothetical protein
VAAEQALDELLDNGNEQRRLEGQPEPDQAALQRNREAREAINQRLNQLLRPEGGMHHRYERERLRPVGPPEPEEPEPAQPEPAQRQGSLQTVPPEGATVLSERPATVQPVGDGSAASVFDNDGSPAVAPTSSPVVDAGATVTPADHSAAGPLLAGDPSSSGTPAEDGVGDVGEGPVGGVDVGVLA